MKKNIILLITLLLIICPSIVYACSTNDGCHNCTNSSQYQACAAQYNSNKNSRLAECNKNVNATAIEQCKRGVSASFPSLASGPVSSTKPSNPTNPKPSNPTTSSNPTTPSNPTIPTAPVTSSSQSSTSSEVSSGPKLDKSTTPGFFEDDESVSKGLKGCERIFGKVEDGKYVDHKSLGYFLQSIFNIIKYIVPIILVGLIIKDLVTAQISGDQDALKKALQKITKRAIIAVLIFFIPTLINYLLKLITVYGTCGIK